MSYADLKVKNREISSFAAHLAEPQRTLFLVVVKVRIFNFSEATESILRLKPFGRLENLHMAQGERRSHRDTPRTWKWLCHCRSLESCGSWHVRLSWR